MKKILIVEDDDTLLQMYAEALSSQNYEILQAREGKTGLELAQKNTPDLILLDIMLPGGLSGFDVLETIRRSDKTKNIPVIVLTNLDSEQNTASKIGATDYLIKVNTNIDQLVEAIKKALD